MTRNYILDREPDSEYASIAVLTTIARVIWEQNFDLAGKLTKRSALARRFLHVTESHIYVNEPNAFYSLIAEFKS